MYIILFAVVFNNTKNVTQILAVKGGVAIVM